MCAFVLVIDGNVMKSLTKHQGMLVCGKRLVFGHNISLPVSFEQISASTTIVTHGNL